MTGQLLSWLATILTLSGVWIAVKHRYGWLLGVVAEIVWVFAALTLHVYALLPLCVAFIAVYARNYVVDERQV